MQKTCDCTTRSLAREAPGIPNCFATLVILQPCSECVTLIRGIPKIATKSAGWDIKGRSESLLKQAFVILLISCFSQKGNLVCLFLRDNKTKGCSLLCLNIATASFHSCANTFFEIQPLTDYLWHTICFNGYIFIIAILPSAELKEGRHKQITLQSTTSTRIHAVHS